MVEISTFPNEMETSMNGNHLEPEIEINPVAHVIPERGVFVTSKGDEFELSGKRINRLLLVQIVNEGKPKIPMIEVTILGKHKQMQANPHDPDYLAKLKEWKEEQVIRSFRYLFNVGIKGQPPQEFVDMQLQFLPNSSDLDLKYMWIVSIVPEEDLNALNEAIIGQSLTTTEGLESAANFSK